MTDDANSPTELARLGAHKGGVARAARLSAEERSNIARRAAEARWGTGLPEAIFAGELKLGDTLFPCAVLSDGTRVLTESDFMSGLGMYRSGALSKRRARDEEGETTPLYLAFKNIQPFVEEHLGGEENRILKFRTLGGGVAHGIRAEIIPKICEIWLDARHAAVLGPRQELIAARAEILMRALAQVGIIALVDEATGYQEVRARDALAKILEKFVATELKKWVRTFPPEFYQQMFRLRGLDLDPRAIRKPQYIGRFTNDLVYKRLAPGVLDELKRLTPKDSKGRHKHQLHRRLTEDVGHPRLREHLASIITLMRVSRDWDEFMAFLDRAHPRWSEQIPLPLELEF